MKVDEAKIKEWERAKKALDKYKALEMELRKEIVKNLTGGATEAGTATAVINGIEVKAVTKVTISIEDKEELLDARDGMPPEIMACFPMSVGFSSTEYKKLNAEDQREVDYYLITKPAAPGLTIKRK